MAKNSATTLRDGLEILETKNNTNLLNGGVNFNEQNQEVVHEVTIFAEPLFKIGSFTVTNSFVNSTITVFILLIFSLIIRKKITQIPRGIQNFFETVMEAGMDLCDSVTGDRKKTIKVFPFVFALFIFILVNNYLGLLPGVGSIGMIALHEGHAIFVPFLRGATADLNTTLALSILAVLLANVFGIMTVGFLHYVNKFINVSALAHPFKEFTHSIKSRGLIKSLSSFFIESLVGLVKFGVGLIEIVGEFAKVASLSFRLFGNIFAGEVLLSSIAVMFAFLAPIPFMFLEVLVGFIQALVFSVLTLVYFSIASLKEEH